MRCDCCYIAAVLSACAVVPVVVKGSESQAFLNESDSLRRIIDRQELRRVRRNGLDDRGRRGVGAGDAKSVGVATDVGDANYAVPLVPGGSIGTPMNVTELEVGLDGPEIRSCCCRGSWLPNAQVQPVTVARWRRRRNSRRGWAHGGAKTVTVSRCKSVGSQHCPCRCKPTARRGPAHRAATALPRSCWKLAVPVSSNGW